MKPESREYIRYRMEQATEALADAEKLLETGSMRAAVNRLYYACFYGVSALLLTAEKHSSKHSGVESLFMRDWVNTGAIPPGMGRFYRRLFKHRQQGDYAYEFPFSQDDVKEWLKQAREFADVISKLVEKEMSNS